MEIERKFLIKSLPEGLENYPKREIEQVYILTKPVIRARRTDGRFTLTVKGEGLLARQELNLPMDEAAFNALRNKSEGLAIKKTRRLIPFGGYTIELDIFEGELAPLTVAEVEFPTIEEANAFTPPDWFGAEVTEDARYSNAFMSKHGLPREE